MRRMKSFKVLLVGDGGVGKSTLLDAFRLKRFIEHEATIGLSLVTCTIEQEGKVKCKLTVFDFSGQPRFVRMVYNVPKLISKAHGAILAFDLSSLMTLMNLLDWVRLIREVNGDIPMVLVGTKADLEREVGEDEIKEFMEKTGISVYIETSAKLMKNVDKPFKTLARMMEQRARGVSH